MASVAHVLHIPRERLEEYVLGRIAAEAEVAEIEEHLLWCGHCPHCLDYVEEMERFIAAQVIELVVSTSRRWRKSSRHGEHG
jgi:hypothetical protein